MFVPIGDVQHRKTPDVRRRRRMHQGHPRQTACGARTRHPDDKLFLPTTKNSKSIRRTPVEAGDFRLPARGYKRGEESLSIFFLVVEA